MLNIERPPFVYISGSFALKTLLDSINSGDIDLYIDVSSSDFNYLELTKWLMSLHSIGYCQNTQQRSIEYLNFHNYSDDIKKRIIKSNLQMTLATFYIYYKKWLISNVLNEVNSDAINNDPYTSNNSFRVIKLINSDSNLPPLDIILINTHIRDYIEKFFDLSIVKNYIDYKGNVVSMNREHINLGICEYPINSYNQKVISNLQAFQFIERVLKYSGRNFKIYMTLECGCKNITCEDSLRLSQNNIMIILNKLLNYTCGNKNKSLYIDYNEKNYTKIKQKISKNLRRINISQLIKYCIYYLRNLIELKKVLASPKFILQEIEDWE